MANDISIRVNNSTDDRNLYIVMLQKPTHANPDIHYVFASPEMDPPAADCLID